MQIIRIFDASGEGVDDVLVKDVVGELQHVQVADEPHRVSESPGGD